VVSSTFSAEGQLVFTAGQSFELLDKKNFPLDGQTRRAKSPSQPANLPGPGPQ